MKNVKENRNKKISVLLKIFRIALISLIAIAVLVFGLYKLVTHQWQDEPKEYSATNQYITKIGENYGFSTPCRKKPFSSRNNDGF